MAGESQQTPDALPDPSVLVTEAITRAIRAERDYVDTRDEVLKEKINVLIQRMDDESKADRVLHETVTRTPTEIQQAIGHLSALMSEKFDSVQTQFKERDERAVRESTANTVAVNAAFAAQKEAAAEQNKSNTTAINKSEEATKEAIGKLGELVKTGMDALTDKVDDLKDRLVRAEERIGRVESMKIGGQEQRLESRQMTAGMLALGVFVLSLIMAAVTIAGIALAR